MSVVVVSASGLETKSHSFKAWFTTSTLIDQGMYDNNGPFVWSQEGKLNLAYWDTTCISILSIACWPKFCSPLLVLSCFWFAPHWRFQLVQKFVKLSHSNLHRIITWKNSASLLILLDHLWRTIWYQAIIDLSRISSQDNR